ncbi:GATA transcription factor 26 [Mucuna pruriens]|uniref:GATA transcription factor 26 n=1 Tax=Mucuna pruriens TaxID=157652 RepID=A0A371GE47_MUCPR|nr:GATA transcription factor 26 [Mucuna pruriens]
MGKQGPCYHCGVASTPLWRNGPPEKPVLCNACGSRWRTKGTLANYTPLHARAENVDCEDQKVSRVKSISLNKNKEVKLVKRKQNCDNAASGGFVPDYNQGYRKVVDEDTSNRSSSGSAVSNSESCAQFGGTDASDLTGPAQSVVWDATVPSKKRTCAGRPKASSVEKLTRDLCTILHEQQSYFSASSEEDLLFESDTPMVSVEIGHGSILIRHPSSIARDEESEASSLSVDNKQCLLNEAYSCSGTIPVHSDRSGMNFSFHGVEKSRNSAGQIMQQEQLGRHVFPNQDKSQLEKLQTSGNHDSLLCLIDLNDVVNYEEFMRNLTPEEQQQLLKYLPVVDTAKFPDSLKNMFNSFQFKENLTYFQQLLAEGVFDVSMLGEEPEEWKTTLESLVLSNLSKSKWKCENKAGKSIDLGSTGMESSRVANTKRMRDSQNQNFPELKATMRSPKRVIIKASCEGKEVVEEGSSFSPKSLFAIPHGVGGLHLLDSLNFVGESSEDLLLEVPSNSSFPQAELLHPTLSYGAQFSTTSSSVHSPVTHP